MRQFRATAISNDTFPSHLGMLLPCGWNTNVATASSWMQAQQQMWAEHCLVILELSRETWWAGQGCVCGSLVCSSPGAINLCDQSLSSQFTASEPPPAPLFTVQLEIPVPVQDPSGGTQCSYSSSSCAGKNNFSGFSLLPWNVSTTWSKDLFFKFLSHRKQPPSSWKQPLCFLLAISSLFSHVHLSSQCGDACQERLLLIIFNSILEHIFERKPNLLKTTQRLNKKINTYRIKFWALPPPHLSLSIGKEQNWIKLMWKIH